MSHAWTRSLTWLLMTGGRSRPKSRERPRSSGTAPWFRCTRMTCRDHFVMAGRRPWLAIAVIAGLFAMHGLGTHGAHATEGSSSMHSEPTSSVPAMGVSGTPMTIHDSGSAVPAGPVPADLSATPLASANDDRASVPSGGAGLLMLCLALLAFGMLWLRRQPNGRPAWTVPRRSLETRVAHLSVTARDLSPPLRAELSIWRC